MGILLNWSFLQCSVGMVTISKRSQTHFTFDWHWFGCCNSVPYRSESIGIELYQQYVRRCLECKVFNSMPNFAVLSHGRPPICPCHSFPHHSPLPLPLVLICLMCFPIKCPPHPLLRSILQVALSHHSVCLAASRYQVQDRLPQESRNSSACLQLHRKLKYRQPSITHMC